MPVDASELREIPIFATLTSEELERLAAGADRVEVGEAGEEVMRAGDFGHSVFVVLDGNAQVAIDGEVVREIHKGDLFGEIAVLASGRRTATVRSSTPMVLVGIFKRDVWALEEKNDAFAAELARLRAEHR